MPKIEYVIAVKGQGRKICETHDIDLPDHLCVPSPDPDEMGCYLDCLSIRFMDSIRCQGPFTCLHCGDRACQNRQHPLFTSHEIINVVFPFCTRVSCERAVTYMAQEDHHRRIKTIMQLVLPPSASRPVFNLHCTVCGSTQTPKRCSRCKLTSYCGPACQKSDWKRHKAECISEMEGN